MISQKLLNFYKNTLSKTLVHFLGSGCIFQPTCSVYAKNAIDKYGIIVGSIKSLKRIIRCHPFYKGSLYDPLK